MPALNFKKQFAPKILSGAKRHTIRETRKVPIKMGDTLYLYTGQRTKNAQLLMMTECVEVQNIKLFYLGNPVERRVQIGNFILSREAKEALAKADGFESFNAFWNFFFEDNPERKNNGFEGQLIKWSCTNCEENNSGIAL